MTSEVWYTQRVTSEVWYTQRVTSEVWNTQRVTSQCPKRSGQTQRLEWQIHLRLCLDNPKNHHWILLRTFPTWSQKRPRSSEKMCSRCRTYRVEHWGGSIGKRLLRRMLSHLKKHKLIKSVNKQKQEMRQKTKALKRKLRMVWTGSTTHRTEGWRHTWETSRLLRRLK